MCFVGISVLQNGRYADRGLLDHACFWMRVPCTSVGRRNMIWDEELWRMIVLCGINWADGVGGRQEGTSRELGV